MAWNVPIKVNDNTYNVRFEKEPTEQDIADAVEHLKDPERGQTLGEGIQSGLAQGFEKGLTATFVSGPGAIGEAVGLEDNALSKTGRQMESDIEAAHPISQDNQNSYPVKAAQAIGQAGSMAVTAPLAGAGTGFRAASMVGKARQIALMGGLAGASAGEEEATRMGITDPLHKSALILGTGAIEFGSELAGGFSAEMAPFRGLMGEGGTRGFIKEALTEGAEEIAAGVPERGLSKLLAKQDPTRPGFTVEGQPVYDAWDVGQIIEEGSLGAVAGGALISAHHILDAMTPQQKQDTKNVAGLPQQLRKSAYEALQKVTAKEQTVVPIADSVDAQTAAAMRVVVDGQRAQVLEDAAKEAASKFAPGWQQREKAPLVHSGEDQDTFFDQGQWMVQTGLDEKGQPVFSPAPNAAELEKARQEFIQTGDLPEGMQPIVPKTPPSVAPTPASVAPAASSVTPAKAVADMTREEYAAYLAEHPEASPTRGQHGFYAELTKRPELRGTQPTAPTKEQQNEIYGRMPAIADALGIRDKLKEPWMQVEMGDHKTKNPDKSRSKLYITFKDWVKSWTPEKMAAFKNLLEQRGYNGSFKTKGQAPFNADKVLQSFDDVVAHAKSDADIQIARQAAEDVWGAEATYQTGLDATNPKTGEHTSHTDLLAAAVSEAVAQKKPITLPRSSYAAPTPATSPTPAIRGGKGIPVEMGRPGYRVTDEAANADYQKQGGWKLHLAVKPGNRTAVDEWLAKNHKGQYKLLQGGDPGESDFTIYVGAKDAAKALADRIQNEIGNLVTDKTAENSASDAIFNPKVSARFDVSKTGPGVPWQNYGAEGIPFDEAAGQAGFGSKTREEFLQRTELDRKRIDRELAAKYGERYTGSAQPAPVDAEAADRAFYGDYKFGEMQRVRQQYPNSPELVTGIESANGDAAAKAFLETHEPKAQLREELEAMTPMAIEDKMRSEGVPEVQISRAKASGAIDVTSAFNSILRQRANRPAGEGAPVEPTKPKTERTRRLITREITGDILDVIEEHGGLISATQAQEQMGPEWFDQNRSLYDDVPRLSSPLHNFIYNSGKMTPDQMAQTLVEEHLRPPGYDVNDFWREVGDASKSRHSQHRARAAQARTQATEQKQATAFHEATASGERAVTSWDIQPGDVLDIEGEKTAVLGVVIEFNPDTHRARIETKHGERTVVIDNAEPGDIILEDGARFGRQRLEEGKAIWVEKIERASEAIDEGEGFGREPLNLLPPEALAAGVLFAPEPTTTTPSKRVQPDEFESRLRRYIEENELPEWTDADIRRTVTFHETRDPDEIADLLEPDTVKAVIDAIEAQMRTPAERRADEPGPAPVAPITQTEIEERGDENPFSDTLWQEAQAIQNPKKNAPPELRRNIGLGAHGQRAVEFQDFIDVEAFTYNAQVKKMASPKTSDSERKSLAASAQGKIDNLRRAYPALTDAQLRGAAIDYSKQVVAAARLAEEGKTFRAPRFNPNNADLPDVSTNGIVFAKTVDAHTNIPELVDGAPFALTAGGQAVIVTDHVRVTLDDRRAATDNDTTAAHEALQRVMAQARKALAERHAQDARKLDKRTRYSETAHKKAVTVGVSAGDVTSAKKGLTGILPHVDLAWSGTRAQIETTLRGDPDFQSEWKDDWQSAHPEATRLQANEAFNDFLEFGLDGREGFTFRGRTYLINDQIAVTEADGSAAGAVRRVLIHEDAHEALDYLRQLDANVDGTWRAFRNGIPAAELDDLATRLYPGLKDWRIDSTMHDDLAHEWWAAKIATIEERGQPEPESIVGKFLSWLRGVFKTLMGSQIDPDNAALLDFMDAARAARFQAREDAGARGVRYSASNPDGDIPPGAIAGEVNDVPPSDGAKVEPFKRPRYNLWSPTRQKAYAAFNSNPDLPEYMRHFTQFLGNETDDERITQSLQPMVEMSNRRLGSVHGEHPDVTEENTALAYADAKAMATRRTFARKYIEEFQTWHSPRDADGRPLHAGDAAVAVHQLNLIQYSIRLLAKTGDAKLWTQMQPFANDVILGDFATMSQAARLLNVRSVFSRNAAAMPTALQLTHGAQHEAAATQVPTGREGLDTLAKSISGAEVKDEIKETFDDFIESSDGQVITAAAESAMTDPTFEVEGYRERAVQLLDEQARAWDQQLDDTLRRLDELEQIRRAIEARKAGNIARPSMSDAQRFAAEIEKFEKDPTGLQKQIDAQKERAKRLLGKLTQQDTSHESKEKRRKRVRDHKHAAKVLSADEEAKKLLKRYEDRNKRTRRDVPAWRQTFADQVKTPKSEEDFTAAIQKHGLEAETAAQLFALAEQLKTEREQAKKDRAAKQQTPEAADRRLERMGEQAAKEPTAKTKGPKRLTAASLISSIAAQILRTPLQQQQMKIVTQTGPDGDPEVDDQGGHAAPWNRDWVAQAFSNAFVEHNIPRAEADVMAEKLAGKFDGIMKNAQAKAAIKAARALNVQEPTIQKIAAAIRSAAIDPLNPNPVVKGLAEAAGFGGLTIQDFQRLAQLDAEITNALPTDVAKASTEVQRILAKVKPPKAFARVMEQLFINGALSSLGVMQLNWFHPTYVLPRLLITDLAGVLGDAVAGKGKANRAETMKLAGYAFQSLWRARHGMLSDAIFSLKNDAYSNRMLEQLSIEHSLYRELMDNWEKLTSGSVTERAVALPKVMWLSSDWVRRMLSSADQMWGGVIQNYVLENEAMRELVQNAGMTTEGAALLVKQAYRNGGDAEAARYAETNDKAEAKLIGRDVMRQSLIQGVNAKLPGAGDRALKSASKTSEMELGNRRGEDSPWFDLPNVALEGIKSMSSAVRNKFDKLGLPFGRAVTGFVSVASNILNRSIYLTPLGLARVAAKKSGMKTRAGGEIYAETMATDGMMRARFYESIVSSFMMGLLALLRLKWDDEDQWFAVTGNGPENAGMREAWLKQGHKPGFLEFRDGNGNVMVGIPYTRGGFDHAALALTTIGALDDMELDGHRMRKADFNWGWAYGEKVLGNQMKQAQFFGIRAWAGSVPSSDKPHALSGQAGYLINPWTPWGGLTKSLFKLYSGAQEQGSVESAFLSNVPVAQVLTGTVVGPRLNFLGDQIGGQPQDVLKKMAERSSYAGFPLYIALDPDSPNEDIYNFIVNKGIAPSMPNRSELESKNGYMDDQRWANYVTARGDLIKTALRRRMSTIQKQEQKDAQREMEKISSDATRAAKKKLGIE